MIETASVIHAKTPESRARKITLIFLSLGVLWILSIDTIVAAIHVLSKYQTTVSVLNGWAFVLVSAILLYRLILRSLNALDSQYRSTLTAETIYRKLFDHSLDAIVLSAPDGAIIDANPSACLLFGRSRGELKSMQPDSLVEGEDERYKKFINMRTSVGSARGEFRFRRPDETMIEGDVASAVFHDAEGIERTFWFIRDVTERRHAEEALIQSQERFSLALRSAKLGSWTFDLQTGRFDPDEVGKLMHGFAPDEILTSLEQSGAHIHPDDIKGIGSKFGHAVRTNGTYENEYRVVPADGTLRWISSHGKVVPEAGILIGIVQDVTERRMAEDELRKSHELFLKTFHNSPISSVLTRLPDRVVIDINEQFEQVFGYRRSEMVGKPISDFDLWADPSERESAAQILIDEGKVEGYEFAFRTNSGIVGYGLFYAEVFGQWEEKYVLTKVVDITERKSAEEKLRRSEERFSLAFRSSPAGLTITRISDGTFIDANDSFLHMFEFTRDEVIGHTSTELNMWSHEERAQILKSQLASGGLTTHELHAHAKSGKIVQLLFSSRLLELGGEKHLLTTMIDITERKHVEEALRARHEELENLYATTPVGLALIDRNMRFLRINEQLAAINGKPVEAHLGRTVAEALPELADVLEPIYRRVLDKGESEMNVEIHGATPAAPNVLRDWLASYHPVRAADGSVTGVSITVLEITDPSARRNLCARAKKNFARSPNFHPLAFS